MIIVFVSLPSVLYYNFDVIALITYKIMVWDLPDPIKNGVYSGLFVTLFVWLLRSHFDNKESKLGSNEEEDNVPKCTNCGFEYVRMTDLRATYLLEHLCIVYHCPNCNKEICRDYQFEIKNKVDKEDES